jgi:hypothetical protein
MTDDESAGLTRRGDDKKLEGHDFSHTDIIPNLPRPESLGVRSFQLNRTATILKHSARISP